MSDREDDYKRARKWVDNHKIMTWEDFKEAFPYNYVVTKGGRFDGGRFFPEELVRDKLVEPPKNRAVSIRGLSLSTLQMGKATSVKFGGHTFSRTSRNQIVKRRDSTGRFTTFTTNERAALGMSKRK